MSKPTDTTGAAASASDAAKTPSSMLRYRLEKARRQLKGCRFETAQQAVVWTNSLIDGLDIAALSMDAHASPAKAAIPDDVRRALSDLLEAMSGPYTDLGTEDALPNHAGFDMEMPVGHWRAIAKWLPAVLSSAALAPPAVPKSVQRLSDNEVKQITREGMVSLVPRSLAAQMRSGALDDGVMVSYAIQGAMLLRDALFANPSSGQAGTPPATPSPDGPEVSAPPGGGGVVEADKGARRLWSAYQMARYGGVAPDDLWESRDEETKAIWRSVYRVSLLAAAPATPETAAGGERETAPATTTECVELAGAIRREFGKLADAHGDAADDIDLTCDRVVTDVLKFLSVRALPGLIYAPAGAQTAGEGWQDISTARKKPRPSIIIETEVQRRSDLVTKSEFIAHWAEDLSGEEQPPFRGWFYDNGYGYVQLPGTPKRWRPLPAPPSLTATAHDAPEGGR